MDGVTLTASAYLSSVPAAWKIMGTADFNGDTKPDILWRDTVTGQNVVWYMDGITTTGSASLSSVGTGWTIAKQ
jgi:hypothetical protein